MELPNVRFDKINKPLFIDHLVYQGASSMPANHFHNAYELYYMLGGERYYFIKERTYRVMKGDFVLIDVDTLHRTVHSGSVNAERILINFSPEFIHDITKNVEDLQLLRCFKQQRHVIRIPSGEQKNLEQLLFKILKESHEIEGDSSFYCGLMLTELLILLNRYAEKTDHTKDEHISPIHQKISKIVVYINQNFSQDIRLGTIAREFGISPCHLSRLFKKVTGFTFIEYLNLLRIKSAQKLLAETAFSVTRIATETGFESATHFGRVFKAYANISPLQYRKQSRQG